MNDETINIQVSHRALLVVELDFTVGIRRWESEKLRDFLAASNAEAEIIFSAACLN